MATEYSLSILNATLPSSTINFSATAVGTKIYLFGGDGYSGNTHQQLNTIQVFDTEVSALTTLSATLAQRRYLISSAAVGTKIYLFGGQYLSSSSWYDVNTIQVFNTETNSISTLSVTLPEAVYGVSSVAVGTKIYLFGGCIKGKGATNAIRVFDTETNSIATLSTVLPKARYNIFSHLVGNKIYLVGGQGDNIADATGNVDVFDIETGTISNLDSITLTTLYSGIASAGDLVYIFGGSLNSTKIQVFNPLNETLETLETALPTDCYYQITPASVKNKIYLFGGSKSSSKTYWKNIIQLFAVTHIPEATFDLTTLDLPTGTRTITVIGKADGYKNSEASEGVEFTVEPSGATIEAGTYVGVEWFNGYESPWQTTQSIEFSSNGQSFVGMRMSETDGLFYIRSSGGYDEAFDFEGGGWDFNINYRFVTISTPQVVMPEYAEWFNTVFTKQ